MMKISPESWFRRGVTLTVFASMLMQACANGELVTAVAPSGDLPILTPEATTNPEGEMTYPTETYCAPKLKICVAHQFDKSGNPLAPAILINSEIVSDLPNNRVILKGDLLEVPEDGWGEIAVDFSDKNGDGKIGSNESEEVDGYTPLKAIKMSVSEFEDLVDGMDLNEEGKLVAQRVVEEARGKGENVKLMFRQILHTTTDEEGEVKLLNMTEKLWMQAGNDDEIDSSRAFGVLEDDLIPFSEQELWKDTQFASLDIINNQDSIDQIVMEVYPADWVETSGGNFVSPAFIEIQAEVAASGERFTLNGADGLIYDGANPAEGSPHYNPDGTITIDVDGETIAIDSADVHFDDEEGMSIDGYEVDEQGNLTLANEEVTLSGVTLTLSEADENGLQIVTEMQVKGDYSDEQKAEKLAMIDPTSWGFEEREAQVIKVGSEIFITPTGEPETRIAEWNFGKNQYVWDWAIAQNLPKGNPIFRLAKTWEMKGVNPIDLDSARVDSGEISSYCGSLPVESSTETMQPVYVYNEDRSETIGGYLLSNKNITSSRDAASGKVAGRLCFMSKDGKVTFIRVHNLSFDIRYWQ